MSAGPSPARALSIAHLVTARTASTSLPSTRTPGKPNPDARWNNGMLDWRDAGTEMAHWLFWQQKTTGVLYTDAQTIASLTSPWLEAPSPKYTATASSEPSRWIPIA